MCAVWRPYGGRMAAVWRPYGGRMAAVWRPYGVRMAAGCAGVTKLHADEVAIPDSLVGTLVDHQFPGWSGLPLRRLSAFGTDHRLFRLGGELLVRRHGQRGRPGPTFSKATCSWREGRLTAVIDFGALGVADPAPDVVPAWTLFEGASRRCLPRADRRRRRDLGSRPGLGDAARADRPHLLRDLGAGVRSPLPQAPGRRARRPHPELSRIPGRVSVQTSRYGHVPRVTRHSHGPGNAQ